MMVQGVLSGGGTIAADSTDTCEARCPAGYFVLSGGWQFSGSITIMVTTSAPSPDGRGWIVKVANPPLGQEGQGYVEAYCGKFTH